MILDTIAKQNQHDIAIISALGKISYHQLLEKVEQVYQWLIKESIGTLLLKCDNCPEWIYIDLACQKANIVFVPVANFFSQQQCQYVITCVEPDIVIEATDKKNVEGDFIFNGFTAKRYLYQNIAKLPKKTQKITFTSGSTGTPKGVCLSIENQYRVAQSLVNTIALTAPQHFCLLSFSTLLENIAGIYAPLMAGGCIYIFTDEERGFNGAQLTSPERLLHSITYTEPQTLILVPELLQFFITAINSGWKAPTSFRFIAVGGSKVANKLIAKAEALSLPVYQGYGLSECASVVSLCRSNNDNQVAKYAGKVLPHVTIEFDNDEVIVSGNCFLGYVNAPETWYRTTIKTGDLGQLHGDNLEIIGRRSNLIINSYGRNISPEWIEAELLATGKFMQVVVFGDAKPYCVALLVPHTSSPSFNKIEKYIEEVNSHLPSYAQVKKFALLTKPLSSNDGLLTNNGRPKRKQIYQYYSEQLSALYDENNHSSLSMPCLNRF